MKYELLDRFGELLMKRVRDEAITDWDMIVDGRMKDTRSQEIRKQLSGFSQEQIGILKELYPQVVDTVLHHLLWTLEQEDSVDVIVKDDDKGTCNIRETSDGLPGELYSEDGWIMRYSKERYREP